MTFKLRPLQLRDAVRIFEDSKESASIHFRLQELLLPLSWAKDDSVDSYLLQVPPQMREDSGQLHYLLYYSKTWFEVCVSDYPWVVNGGVSTVFFRHFPPEKYHLKATIQEVFELAIAVFGAYGMGPDGTSFSGRRRDSPGVIVPRWVADNQPGLSF